jgi:hypothetical protein
MRAGSTGICLVGRIASRQRLDLSDQSLDVSLAVGMGDLRLVVDQLMPRFGHCSVIKSSDCSAD